MISKFTPITNRLRKTALSFVIMLTAVVTGLIFASTNLGRNVDGIFFDTTAPLLGSPHDVDDPIVIMISEKDYSNATTPLSLWGTRLIPLLERIESAKPHALGLDLILPQFPLARVLKDHDKRLFRTLKRISRSCRLVSGYGITPDGRMREPFLVYRKIFGPDGYGYLNLFPDPDGVCRRQVLLLPATRKGTYLYSFAWLVSGKGTKTTTLTPDMTLTPDWRNSARMTTLTFGEALKTDPYIFSKKTVLIGVDFEFEDRHDTPASKMGEPGVVFQARVVEALMNGRFLVTPAWPLSLLLPELLFVILSLVITRKASHFKITAASAILLAGILAIMIAGLASGVVLRPSAAIIGLLLTSLARIFQGYFRVKDTFGRYVTRQIRDEILSGRIPLDGEMKEVTVLFADLRNFTPMVEATPPKEVVKIMNGYFKEMATAIREHEGLVLQYIGDEIEAVFGAPVTVPEHRRMAVRAALDMRERLKHVNETLARHGFTQLTHGIGIHTGDVLAANIGGGDRLTYSLVGDTVNLASRLQGLNKQFGTDIIISGQTLAGLDGDVPVERLPDTPIKGKSSPVEIFSVL